MPEAFRLLSSNKNRRNINEHPIETVLINDIFLLIGNTFGQNDSALAPSNSDKHLHGKDNCHVSNSNDLTYFHHEGSKYVAKYISEAFLNTKDSYFCLDAENYYELKKGLDSQCLESIPFNDNWNFEIEQNIIDPIELSDTHTYLNDDFEQEEDDDIENNQITPILDVINNYRQFIILGNAGAGKTTTLKKIFLDSCFAYSNEENDIIPIYIQLTKLNPQNDILTSAKKIAGGEWISYFINRGKALILFDGLNEISDKFRENIIYNIKDFIFEYSSCALVFTSRLYNFMNYLDLPLFKLLDLSSEARCKFIEKKGGDKNLYNEIEANKELRDIASSPMMLTMLIESWKNDKIIPKNKGQLYNAFINNKLQQEHKKTYCNYKLK
jgi:predicted NACHT family NTPase